MVSLFIISALLIDGSSINSLIPALGSLALGSQRLLVSLQQAFSSWGGIRSHSEAVVNVLDMVNLPSLSCKNNSGVVPITQFSSFKVTDLSYIYPNSLSSSLKNVSFSISKGDKVGLIGETGSGKSTLVNIILGLLPYSSGSISINNIPVSGINLINSWNHLASYVPQDIYLSDCTIIENIAIGLSTDNISWNHAIESAKKAFIHDFITSLPEGYDTLIGERGVKLSGGQRQRLGLARAFYRNSSLVILDEATSALDSDTESSVMSSLQNFDKDTTIILIAHRLSTLQACNKILKVQNGSVISVNPGSLDLAN